MIDVHIPYGGYWCSPFTKWQGSLSHLHSIEFAAYLCRETLTEKAISFDVFDAGVLGMTIPQQHCFYGLPWLAGMAGLDKIGGPTISQACATSARVLVQSLQEIQNNGAECVLAVTTDRTSNGPQIYYPNPMGMGGTGNYECWTLDNFSHDPFINCDMTETGENCARKWNVSTEQQHEVVVRRYEQYQDALADESAFLKKYMPLPFSVPDARYRKIIKSLDGDEGIFQTTAESLAKLKPVKENGTITFGSQTFPADGAAGMIVTTREKAEILSADSAIQVTIKSYGQAREAKGFMPAAPIPASKAALEKVGIAFSDLAAVKSHNPFVVNDIIFSIETGVDVMNMNNYGSSLIWGHPQGPTGMRAIIELIEELVLKGGGWGLFQGCAAGDTAMAVVLKVDDNR